MAESLSFNRSIGQLYGLLYISPSPLSLDEIAQKLSMSKGNASINLRTLENWGAVRPVSVDGSRRDYYEANRNIRELALRRTREGLSRRLETAEQRLAPLLEKLEKDASADPELKARLKEVRSLVATGQKLLSTLPKLTSLLFG